jgi:hypothetical protein
VSLNVQDLAGGETKRVAGMLLIVNGCRLVVVLSLHRLRVAVRVVDFGWECGLTVCVQPVCVCSTVPGTAVSQPLHTMYQGMLDLKLDCWLCMWWGVNVPGTIVNCLIHLLRRGS